MKSNATATKVSAKDNLQIVQVQAADTWLDVAMNAAAELANNLELLDVDGKTHIHLVLPNGNGAIVNHLTDTTISVMPGTNWDSFDKYGLFQTGNGVMFDRDMFNEYEPGKFSIDQKVIDRLRLVFMRSDRAANKA